MISNVIGQSHGKSKSSQCRGLSNFILATPIFPAIGLLSIVFMTTANLVNFDLVEEKVKLDSLLMTKLVVVLMAGTYGLYGFLVDSRIRKVFLNYATTCLAALSAAYIVTSIFAVNKSLSLVSAGCILCAILAITAFCVQHGRQKAVLLIFYSLSLFLIGSWIAYFFVPSVGVFNEPLAEGITIKRMSGLSHPNTLGQYSAMTLILGAFILRTKIANGRFVMAIMLLAAIALYFSMSRTSTAAAIGGLAFLYRDKIFTRTWVLAGLTIVTFAVSAMLAGSAFFEMENRINDKVVGLLSKSADSTSDELTTATGRIAIWSKAVELIKDRPVTGWGAGSSKELLKDYSQYTHNLFLNVWLSTGILGGMFITLLMILMLYQALVSPSMVADSLIVYIILNGLFENVIFSNVASAPTLVFTLAVIWRHIPKLPGEKEVEYDSANS